MLIHTLNLTSSDVEFAKFPGRELLVPRLKGEKKGEGMGGRAEDEREKGRERIGQGKWQGGKRMEGKWRRGKGGGNGMKFCCNAVGGWTPLRMKACS